MSAAVPIIATRGGLSAARTTVLLLTRCGIRCAAFTDAAAAAKWQTREAALLAADHRWREGRVEGGGRE